MRRSTLGLLGIGLVFVVFVFYSLMRVEPLQVSSCRLLRLGDSVVVRGMLTNTSPHPVQAALDVRFFDRGGRKIGHQELLLGQLQPGKSVDFATSPREGAGVEDFTVLVDHGTNMYGN